MRRLFYRGSLFLALAGLTGLLTGCGDDSNKAAVQSAENAAGINPNEPKKTTTETRDLTEVKETKVIDSKTGAVISDKKEVTPVKIDKETTVKTEVKAEAGSTKTTGK
jgi:ABC-type uncharacterized transport system auxiliary subunit